MKVTMIPVQINALGTLYKILKSSLEGMEIRWRVEAIETTVLLRILAITQPPPKGHQLKPEWKKNHLLLLLVYAYPSFSNDEIVFPPPASLLLFSLSSFLTFSILIFFLFLYTLISFTQISLFTIYIFFSASSQYR